MILGLGNSSRAVYARNASRFPKAQVSIISTGTPNGQISVYPRTLPRREWHTLCKHYISQSLQTAEWMESSSSNGNQTSTLPIARSRHQVAMKSLWCISQYSKRNQPSVSELRPPPFNPDKLPVRKPLPKKLQELMDNDEEDVVTVVRLTTT